MGDARAFAREKDAFTRARCWIDKCTQRIDEWGIFNGSMAVRRDN
ncbi:class I SAM-dependent methyltransferase family protein [Escherichia coli]